MIASKFSIDQLMMKLNIAQNILSSIGEHWAEALGARDSIAQLSNVTIQRLLESRSAASSTMQASASSNSLGLRHRNVQATSVERPSREADRVATSSNTNLHGQTSAENIEGFSAETWATLQQDACTSHASVEYPNLFDDLLQTDLEAWNGTSDIDGLVSDLLSSSYY